MAYPVAWASLPTNGSGDHFIDQTAYDAIRDSLRADTANRNGGKYNYADIGDLFTKRILNHLGNEVFHWTAAYNFTTLAQGVSATQGEFALTKAGGTLSSGSNTVTIAPVPHGVNATNANFFIEVANGTGASEICPVTGGTAVAGSSSGTLIFTADHAHSGAWTVGSASAGILEAIWGLPATGGEVQVSEGVSAVKCPITNRNIPMWIAGRYESSLIVIDADFDMTADGIFQWTEQPANVVLPGGMEGLTIFLEQPDSDDPLTYTQYPPVVYFGGTHRPLFRDLVIVAAWDGFYSPGNDGVTIENVTMSFFGTGVKLPAQTDSVRIDKLHLWPVGLTNDQNTAFRDPATANVGLDFENVQHFAISGLACVSGGGVANMHAGGGGSPSGTIVNGDHDTFGGFVMSDGNITITNVNTSTSAGLSAFTVNGGLLTLTDPKIYVSGGTGVPIIVNIASAPSGSAALVTPGLTIIGGEIINYEGAVDTITCITSGSFTDIAEVKIIGTRFDRIRNTAAAGRTVTETGGTGSMKLMIIGTSHSDIGAGSGIAFSFTSDAKHTIIGNDLGGWGILVPGQTLVTDVITTVNFQCSGNIDVATGYVDRTHNPLNLQGGTVTVTVPSVATLSTQCGVVTSESLTTAAGGAYVLTLTNSFITANSIVLVNAFNGTNTQGALQGDARATPGSGSVSIAAFNSHASQAFNGTIKIQFLVINPS